MKVLVIGGNGYIGSQLCRVLTLSGLSVDAYGNRHTDYNLLSKEILSQYQYIVLLAGHSSVPSCNGDLKSPWNNNVRNFTNLIEKLDDQKVIYASSSSVYGSFFDRECVETDVVCSYMNNYDLTKMVLDQVASNYMHAGKSIVGLRFGTVAGASSLIRKDILLNSMTYSAVMKNEIHIANSEIRRPYLSLADLSFAISKIILGDFKSGIYNLANGNCKIIDYAKKVQQHTGAEIINKGVTPGVYDFQINTDKFQKDYKFTFQDNMDNVVSGLIGTYNSGIAKVVDRLTYFQYNG